MGKKTAADSTICQNRRAGHRFEILEKLECGIVLTGTEVKSIREKQASIEEGYARIEGQELWLIGAHVATYRFGHDSGHEPLRRRKLLVHRREIAKLRVRVEQKGLTLVPLRLYFNERGIVKLTLGVARGKRQVDKRADMKARDHKREMDRAVHRRR